MLEVEFPNHMIVELWLCQFCQWLHVGPKDPKVLGDMKCLMGITLW